METSPLRKIRSVEPRQNYKLLLIWSTGLRTTIDLSNTIEQGGIFSELRNVEVFGQVRVGEKNRTIEWPSPKDDLGYPLIDIDADALAAMSQAQRKTISFVKIQSLIKNVAKVEKPQESVR